VGLNFKILLEPPHQNKKSLMEKYFLSWKNIFYYGKCSSVVGNSAIIFHNRKYCSMTENAFP
jgi:hypothetical protein